MCGGSFWKGCSGYLETLLQKLDAKEKFKFEHPLGMAHAAVAFGEKHFIKLVSSEDGAKFLDLQSAFRTTVLGLLDKVAAEVQNKDIFRAKDGPFLGVVSVAILRQPAPPR